MRTGALAAIGGFALVGVTSSQVQWNELPLAEGVFREYSADYRSDIIDIPLEPLGELEYKLGLNEGDSIVYQWDAVDLENPQMLYAEFHGHTPPADNAGDLMFYRKATGATERGTLVAPFTGIHGWYLRNDGEKPLVVRLKVAGFYELLPQ
ncbi:MAG TPA: hypothetical protein VLI71_08650 [Gammaproteobacteria bacterium]|nr:hypothetical protein [Gammaproteobacteria bacterium]